MSPNTERGEKLSAELQSGVADAGKLIVQGAAGGTTATVGMATALSYLPVVLGSCASVSGIILTWYLIKQSRNKIEIYDRQLAEMDKVDAQN